MHVMWLESIALVVERLQVHCTVVHRHVTLTKKYKFGTC